MESQLSLAERDLQILKFEEEIQKRKNLLVKKKKELNEKQKLNQFLEHVKDDYYNYYDYILNEKQKQYDSLMLLKEYINELIKTEDLKNEQIIAAKYDEKEIIKEINKIKSEMDCLINK